METSILFLTAAVVFKNEVNNTATYGFKYPSSPSAVAIAGIYPIMFDISKALRRVRTTRDDAPIEAPQIQKKRIFTVASGIIFLGISFALGGILRNIVAGRK